MHELPTHTVCTLKTCLLGNSGVGKSSLGLRFVENRCPNLHSATIGASFLTKVLVLDKIVVKFQIWDTAGQEDYRSLAPMYFRAAKIVLLVFDMTNPQSFHDLAYWVKVLQQHNLRDCSLGVAANKSDLYNAVDLSDTMDFCKSIEATFMPTSAKTGNGVTELFTILAEKTILTKVTITIIEKGSFK